MPSFPFLLFKFGTQVFCLKLEMNCAIYCLILKIFITSSRDPKRNLEECCCSVMSCPDLCHPTNCSMQGFHVLLCLPEFAQSHVWVSDAIQSSHPLSPLSPPVLILPALGSFPVSQHFASSDQSIGVSASVLPKMNIKSWLPLRLTGLNSLQFKGPSRVFSNTTVQKHQFFGAQLSL